jgi:hypothetical protein
MKPFYSTPFLLQSTCCELQKKKREKEKQIGMYKNKEIQKEERKKERMSIIISMEVVKIIK